MCIMGEPSFRLASTYDHPHVAMIKKRIFDQTAQSIEFKSADGTTSTLHFWLFTPEGYQPKDTSGSKKWPLMMFLHGSGERGDDLELVKKWGPPKLVESNPKFPLRPFVTAMSR